MKSFRIFVLVLLLAVITIGCAAHQYNMGNGPQTGVTETARQWYILYGLVPITQVDIPVMIGDTQNYQVRTAAEPLDIVINIFTSYVTVTSRTVTVKK